MGLGGNQGDDKPAAYLNYIFFDETDGFDVTNQEDNYGWQVVSPTPFTQTLTKFSQPIKITAPGYIYVYLSYENQSNNFVYFDDLKVTYQKSQVVQSNNYYAFGLQTSDSWTRIDTRPNQYLYNAGSELNNNTNWYETPLRGYDAAIGRFHGVDILASSTSSLTPYQYANNDPVYWSDPTGAYAGGDEWWNAPRSLWGHFSYGGPEHWASEQALDATNQEPNWDPYSSYNDGMFGRYTGFSFNSLSSFFRAAWFSSYGGTWSSNSGGYLFQSHEEAFGNGVAYNEYHNSWAHTEYKSFAASFVAFGIIKQSGTIPTMGEVNAILNPLIASITDPEEPWYVGAWKSYWDFLGKTLGIRAIRSANVFIYGPGGHEVALEWGTKEFGEGPSTVIDLNDPDNFLSVLNHLARNGLLDAGEGIIDIKGQPRTYYFGQDPHGVRDFGILFHRTDNPNVYDGVSPDFGAPYTKQYKLLRFDNGRYALREIQ